MRFGVREICDVVFKPLTSVDIGNQHFDAGQPVLYLDTAKTSTLEGAATTVYAQGGKGNPRLIGWDGEKTITFTVEDALMSPTSFAMLSGAGVVKGTGALADDDANKIYVHTYYDLVVEKDDEGNFIAKLTDEERNGATLVVTREAPVYPILLDSAGAQAAYLSAVTEDQISVEGEKPEDAPEVNTERGEIDAAGRTIVFTLAKDEPGDPRMDQVLDVGQAVRIDCYTVHTEGATEIQIDAGTFAGYYYIEASTLFRDEATGVDMAAEFIIPRGKIQSNFTFTMANSGDPSTFTFTIDAFPAYTKFNKNKKVMAVLQIIDAEGEAHNYRTKDIIGHEGRNSDDDVYKWYEKSVFPGGNLPFAPSPDEPGADEPAEPTIEVTAEVPEGISLGSYDADDGFEGAVTQEGDNFIVTGTFTKQDSANEDLKFPLNEATGYYLPIKFTGTDDTAIKRLSNNKITEIGKTGDGSGVAVIILYVDPSNKVINFKEYADRSAALADSNGKAFTVDCSGCTFE